MSTRRRRFCERHHAVEGTELASWPHSNTIKDTLFKLMPVNSSAVRKGGDSTSTSVAAAMSRGDFMAALERAKAEADGRARGFAVCLVDVDQLRNINDGHGQRVGDAVILGVAQEILNALALPEWRSVESRLGRYDGDSFIVLLNASRLESAARLGETLRRDVSVRITAAEAVTVSVGVAAYRLGETTDALLARIEKALHLAKQFGRDRVEIAWSPETREDSAGITALE
jgi:diguanylate cyclase (GGDEF)-like protein